MSQRYSGSRKHFFFRTGRLCSIVPRRDLDHLIDYTSGLRYDSTLPWFTSRETEVAAIYFIHTSRIFSSNRLVSVIIFNFRVIFESLRDHRQFSRNRAQLSALNSATSPALSPPRNFQFTGFNRQFSPTINSGIVFPWRKRMHRA